MPSPFSEEAISDALWQGRTLLKFIFPNDVGTTDGHQRGYYLPKKGWQVYTPRPPAKGVKTKKQVRILWQDGRTNDAVVTWYGEKTRKECRLTCFGRSFPFVERRLCEPEIVRVSKSVEEFLANAQSIIQQRKVCAGHSLANDVERLLRDAGVPFDMRAEVDGTRPNNVISGPPQYIDKSYPAAKLFAIGVKATCKDRWRQVLNEARRVRNKHNLTLQQGKPQNQLKEMKQASVALVVPGSLHERYPKSCRAALLTIEAFISEVGTKPR